MKSWKRTGRARGASCDLRRAANARGPVRSKRAGRSKFCDHATNLIGSCRAVTVCPEFRGIGLREIAVCNCIRKIKAARSSALVNVNPKQTVGADIPHEVQAEEKSWPELVLQSQVHVHGARRPVIRRKQT